MSSSFVQMDALTAGDVIAAPRGQTGWIVLETRIDESNQDVIHLKVRSTLDADERWIQGSRWVSATYLGRTEIS